MLEAGNEIHILLVDNDIDYLNTSARFLEQANENFKVTKENNPKNVLDKLKKESYDIIVSAHTMPIMNGIELFNEIRNHNSNIPFILFTGDEGREKTAMKALNKGVDRYCKKGNAIKSNFKPLAQAIEQEVANFRDETEKKKNRQIVEEMTELVETIFLSVPDPAYFISANANVNKVNDSFCETLNVDRKDVIGRSIDELDFIPESERAKLMNNFKNRLDGEEIGPYIININLDDKEVIFEINNKTVEYSGNVVGVVGVARDITEKVKSSKERKKVKERYEGFFEKANMIIITTDKDGFIKRVNKKALEVSKYSEEELVGESILKIAHPEDKEEYIEFWKDTLNGEKKEKELRAMSKDGKTLWLKIGGNFLHINGLNEIQYNAHNITKRKEMEKKLKESKEQLERIFDTAAEGITIINLEGKIIDCNEKLVEMGDFDSKDKIIGTDAFEFIAPEDKEKAEEYFKKVMRGEEITSVEFTFLDSQEKKYPAELSASIIRDSEGSPDSIMSIMRDITKRKEAEEKKDFLHSILRHNLSNKLSVIEGYLSLLEDSDNLSDEDLEFTDNAKEALKEGSNLIKKVRMLKDLAKEKKKVINISDMIRSCINTYRNRVEDAGFDLQTDIKSDCKAWAGDLTPQAINNIIENSIFHSEGSKLKISSEKTDDYCKITVEDDGVGITDDKKDKIFVKGCKGKKSAGTGLGLFLVKEIIEGYGGEVTVKDSELGGARFDIKLKRSESHC